MAWATEAEALALTGATVAAAHLSQAQGVVDLFSGVTEDDAQDLSARNLRLLKAATAYQSAWMLSQIDVTSRTDVSQADQDGASFTVAHADSLVLAPLAKRALDRLTWRGAHSVRVRRPCRTAFSSMDAYQAAWLRDEDGRGGWQAL